MILPPAMRHALELASEAAAAGEVPVGAVVVDADGRIVAAAANRTLADRDPSAHAEMLAVREASARLGSERLVGHDLYVTLEPCAMCAGAIALARIRRLYYGAADPKGGAVENGVRFFESPTCHHRPEIYPAIGEAAASALLKEFFRARR
jgi:tRNA(adenine34) deaminase